MRLEEGLVARRLYLHARPSVPPGFLERLAHRRTVVAVRRLVDVLALQEPGERLRSEERPVVPLLIAEHHDVDTRIAAGFLDRPRRLQRVDAAERPVEPSRMILAFQMRAGQ